MRVTHTKCSPRGAVGSGAAVWLALLVGLALPLVALDGELNDELAPMADGTVLGTPVLADEWPARLSPTKRPDSSCGVGSHRAFAQSLGRQSLIRGSNHEH